MDNLLNALNSIDVSGLDYTEWVIVGMALKAEGYDYSVWDNWSAKDPSKYKNGECKRKWESFNGTSSPVTGATIMKMAKDRGFVAKGNYHGEIGWNDTIEYDGSMAEYEISDKLSPVEQLKLYLNTLFADDDIVGYVSNDVWQGEDKKWMPSKGVFDRTKKELVKSLEKHPDDLGATIGDWKEECGAWIRFNPLDGKGCKNDNVTKFKYALVESDSIPVIEQEAIYRRFELPIACLVHSGGKSLHAIVKIDAKDYDDYKNKVDFLYDFLDKNNIKIDRQNRNPSRLSRMPGVTRNGNQQTLVATNIGRKSYVEWLDYVEGVNDELPPLVNLAEELKNPPKLPEELIEGVLRCGHKMLISGPSKAGKSFLLMELSICLAEGIPWLSFKCKQTKVLYVNLEIDPPSCTNRFNNIYKAMNVERKNDDNIEVWNLRGHAVPLDKLVPKLIRRISNQHFGAVIIDPIYKVITGDENNASEMGAFCNQFDKICAETGCATIYCHHHSKGAQGFKKAMDRASGSGVFARDPDAQLDMTPLNASDEFINEYADEVTSTCWKLECSLREFPNFKPINFWFEYPIHKVDKNDVLSKLKVEGDPSANLAKSGKRNQTPEMRKEAFDKAFNIHQENGSCKPEELAEHLRLSIKTVEDRVREFSSEYILSNKRVYRIKKE